MWCVCVIQCVVRCGGCVCVWDGGRGGGSIISVIFYILSKNKKTIIFLIRRRIWTTFAIFVTPFQSRYSQIQSGRSGGRGGKIGEEERGGDRRGRESVRAFVCQEEKSPRRCSGSNTAQLSIGTAMHCGSEHRKTGRVFSYPFNATSKYS